MVIGGAPQFGTLQRSDAGVYTCVANNLAGERRAEFTITVQGIYEGRGGEGGGAEKGGVRAVSKQLLLYASLNYITLHPPTHTLTDIPLITEPPQNVAAGYGQDLVFRCVAVGPPAPNITWSKTGSAIQVCGPLFIPSCR